MGFNCRNGYCRQFCQYLRQKISFVCFKVLINIVMFGADTRRVPRYLNNKSNQKYQRNQ